MADGDPDNFGRSVGKLPLPKAWERLRIEVALPPGAGTGTMRVTADGQLALTGAIGSETQSVEIDRLQLGIAYSTDSAVGAQVRYDDVGCSIR